MKYKKKFFYLFVLVLFSNSLHAQDNSDNSNNSVPYTHLPIIGQPSPTAAALGTYANYPVGNFTGVPDINIPLYEINEGGYKLPISLSYNASGVKVDDVAGWTGLGWSLNAGGVITRNVVGGADDVNAGWAALGSSGSQSGKTGFLFYNYNATVQQASQSYPGGSGNPVFNPSGTNPLNSQIRGLRWSDVDTEPDVFYFNFNGHSGKFVFSQGTNPVTNQGTVSPSQHQVLLIPYQNLKISYNGPQITAFTVVDEEGNQYVFGAVEFNQSSTSEVTFESQNGANNSSIGYNTAWYLTQITTVNGKVIHFNYVQESSELNMPLLLSQRGFNTTLSPGTQQYSGTTTSYNDILGQRLSSIVGDDFEVVFNATLDRQDVINTNALTNISIFKKDLSGNLTPVKQFNLNYNYLQSPNAPANNGSTNNGYERLMLNSVQELAADGVTTKPPYQFVYNNAVPLPQRFSTQQDIWGFFNNNGTTNSYNVIPTVYVYPSLLGTELGRFSIYPLNIPNPYFIIQGADRTANASAVVSGTLTNITYPTGGSTTFLFEPNQFYDSFNTNVTGGGIRLKQQTDYDGISHTNDIIKQYTYTRTANPSQSSGVLFNMPVLAYTENFIDYWGGTTQTVITPAVASPTANVDDPTTIAYYNHNLVIGSVPQGTMSGFDGINIGYSTITESINGNGSTVRTYSTPGQYGAQTDMPGTDCSPTAQGYCDGLFSSAHPNYAPYDATYISGYVNQQPVETTDLITPDLTGLDYAQAYSMPFAPATNYDWNRGLLMSETKFNQAGNMVSQENNLYNTYTPQNAGPQYVYGLRLMLAQNYLLNNNVYARVNISGGSYLSWPMYSHYCRYPIITNIATQLSSKTVNSYSSANPTDFTSVTTNYTYSANCFKPSLVESTTSKGDLLDKYMTYPSDYTQLTSSATDIHSLSLYNLQQQHVIDQVVEQYAIRKNIDGSNSRVTQAYISTFKSNSPISNEVFPDAVYRTESVAPITSFTPASITNSGIIKAPAYMPFISVDDYDTNGNISQDHLASDVYNSYIWDYNNQYPVAKVTNAALTDIAYTSFESDGNQSRWAISPSAITVDPTSPTGNKCYNLGAPYVGIDAGGLNSSNTYIVSYWAKNRNTPLTITNDSSTLPNTATTGPTINGWTFYMHKVTGTTDIELLGSCYIDEVRLYPINSQMVTSTYDQAGNLITATDAKNQITHYEYDNFQRLVNIKDTYGNIIKNYCYNYTGQQTGCPIVQTQPIATSSTNTFVSSNLIDNEWKQEAPPGYTVAADNGTTINAGGNAGVNAGRFAYFSTAGTVSPLTYINGNLTFTAKGSGTIEIQLIATYNTSIQARKTFTLSSVYQNFSWALSNLYPQTEMMVGVIVNGGNSSAQASVQFQNNFSLSLNQLGLTSAYTRYRADSTSLIGNSEKAWYGWNDNYNAPRKKYLQHSAYARMRFQTTAKQFVIEYVRDFYDKNVVNLFDLNQSQNSSTWASNGAVTSGSGAINTFTQVTAGQTYTISGLLTTSPTIVWYNGSTPLSAPQALSNAGTAQAPVYQVIAPATATNMGLLVQNTNDTYFAYTNCMIQQGARGTVTAENGTIPSAFVAFTGYVPSHISGPTVFINGTLYKYYQVEGTDVAKVIQFVTDTLPAGNKTVEIMMPGQGTYLPADPHVRRAGNYLRAVYFPGSGTTVSPANTVIAGSVAYIHDSILSGYNISSDAQNNVWMMMTKRNSTYGFTGDIFSEGYAGRILYTDISTPALTTAFANKLASFGVDKFWFQIGVNDYGFNTPLPVFYAQYKSLIEQLKVLRPNAKIYIQATGPESYEGPNSETVTDDGLTSTGPSANDFRDVQRALATSHSYCEYVNFEGLFSPTVANLSDGIHPTDAGNILYANGIKNNSSLLGTVPAATALAFYRSTARDLIQTIPGIYTITATGGTSPYTFSLVSGTLPAGLTLNADGTITGTPTANGTASISVKVTDSKAATVTQTFSVTVNPVPTVIVTPLHIINAEVSMPYTKTFLGRNGYGPYTFAVTSGAIPAGMTFNPATGVLAGTPTTAGTAAFTITATDHWGFHGSSAYSLITGTTTPAPLTDSFTVTATVSASNHLILTGHLNDYYSQPLLAYIAAYFTPSGGSLIYLDGSNIEIPAGQKDGTPADFGPMGLSPGSFSATMDNGGIAPTSLNNVTINYNATTTQSLSTTYTSPSEAFALTATINSAGHLLVTATMPNAPASAVYAAVGVGLYQGSNSNYLSGPSVTIPAGATSSGPVDFGLLTFAAGSISATIYNGGLSPASSNGYIISYTGSTSMTLTMP